MTTHPHAARFKPPGSEELLHAPTGALAFLFSSAKSGRPGAMMFRPKGKKPTYNYVFGDTAARDKYVADFFAAELKAAEADAKQAAEKAAKLAAGHGMKPGDILTCSWGYDQTNVDFYQVVRDVGRNTIAIRQISSTSVSSDGWTGKVVAVPDAFKGDEMVKRVDANGYVRISSYSSAKAWDGKPQYTSSYA